jgi:hypothetical protein
MTTPSTLASAVRTAIADHNKQPAIDRNHLTLLRAAATRLDAADTEETALRERYAEACRLLREAQNMGEIGDINPDMEDDGLGWRQWAIDLQRFFTGVI